MTRKTRRQTRLALPLPVRDRLLGHPVDESDFYVNDRAGLLGIPMDVSRIYRDRPLTRTR